MGQKGSKWGFSRFFKIFSELGHETFLIFLQEVRANFRENLNFGPGGQKGPKWVNFWVNEPKTGPKMDPQDPKMVKHLFIFTQNHSIRKKSNNFFWIILSHFGPLLTLRNFQAKNDKNKFMEITCSKVIRFG